MKIDSNIKVKHKALNLLEFRSHSKQELIKKLRKNFDESQARLTAAKMEKIGLLDDKKFALNYALDLYRRKKFAKKRIMAELFLKGISEEDITFALKNEEIDEEIGILNLINKKFKGKLSDENSKRRAIAFLQRYGYEWRAIKKALLLAMDEGEEINEYF